MITGGTENLSSAGATLLGSFSGATGTIYDRGFEWGTSSSSLSRSEYLGSASGTSGSFSVSLGSLDAGVTYYYRAYVRLQDNQGHIGNPIYGEIRSFTTKPAGVAGLQYLGGYEIPALSLASTTACTDSGPETFYDSTPTNWYKYATTNSKRVVVTHTYAYGGKEYCNYTVLVDKDKKAPLWNAFEMSPSYPDNNVGRTGSWTQDPALGSDWQQSSSTGTHSRGHFCASSYRQTCTAANKQTFYYTNQALQYQDGFNSGVWSQLEQDVAACKDGMASNRKLFVVVGVLYENSQTAGGVPVPSHFYKCLMLCTFNGSTMTAAQGCAYLFTNEAHTGSYSVGLTSIDAVEARAGFDFFAAVPASLQAAAESSTSELW